MEILFAWFINNIPIVLDCWLTSTGGIFAEKIKLPKNILNGSHQIAMQMLGRLEIFKFAAASGPFNNEMVTFSALCLNSFRNCCPPKHNQCISYRLLMTCTTWLELQTGFIAHGRKVNFSLPDSLYVYVLHNAEWFYCHYIHYQPVACFGWLLS